MEERQTNKEDALREFQVDCKDEAKRRQEIKEPGLHENFDFWWKEAKSKEVGVYAD